MPHRARTVIIDAGQRGFWSRGRPLLREWRRFQVLALYTAASSFGANGFELHAERFQLDADGRCLRRFVHVRRHRRIGRIGRISGIRHLHGADFLHGDAMQTLVHFGRVILVVFIRAVGDQ